ncbi:SdpI family protein [Fictibacillus macauensis]|nr:SdpI family protein [Fictibacillus macauensis]
MKWKSPKHINAFYGYRTARSMRSQEAWDYAQQLLALYTFRIALLLTALSTLTLAFLPYSINVITLSNLGMGMLALFIPIFLIENKLKDFNSLPITEEHH